MGARTTRTTIASTLELSLQGAIGLPARPPKDPTTAVPELCQDKPGEPDWLSQVRADIYRTVCSSAAWFDGFFGSAPEIDGAAVDGASVALPRAA